MKRFDTRDPRFKQAQSYMLRKRPTLAYPILRLLIREYLRSIAGRQLPRGRQRSA